MLSDEDRSCDPAADATGVAANPRQEGAAVAHADLTSELGLDDVSYRICGECGQDCSPEPTSVQGVGVRVAFICAVHGLQTVVNPFEPR